MSFRRLLRGRVPEQRLWDIAEEVTDRYDEPLESVQILDVDNWLSTPCVVNEEYFLKVISGQNSLVHALLTTGRNLGVFSSGRPGFFDHFGTPLQMAEHELDATRQMRELGVNAPEPLDAFEFDGMGVLVLEFLPSFTPLNGLEAETVEEYAPQLFESLSRIHEADLAHGDLRPENVLVADDLYFIDATKVREGSIEDARAYDLACALASLEPLIGADAAVAAASEHYDDEELLAAEPFLDFVNIRPDHAFDAVSLKGAIGKEVV